jgi:hypothetical protein
VVIIVFAGSNQKTVANDTPIAKKRRESFQVRRLEIHEVKVELFIAIFKLSKKIGKNYY